MKEIIKDVFNFGELFSFEESPKKQFVIFIQFETDSFKKSMTFIETLFERVFGGKPKFEFERKGNQTIIKIKKSEFLEVK